MKKIINRCLATINSFVFYFYFGKTNLGFMSVRVYRRPWMCVLARRHRTPRSSFKCLCLCRCVFKSSRVCVPSPALQLVSLTDPSCNGDISAPVLAGEEEGGEGGWGESGDYLTLSESSEAAPENRVWYFQKKNHLSCRGEVESRRVAGAVWPAVGVLLILILSL